MEPTIIDGSTAAGGGTSAARTLTAVFESDVAAEQAIAALRDAGITEARMRVAGQALEDRAEPAAEARQEGLWERLIGFLMPPEDGTLYEEGLRRGHAVLTVAGYPATREPRVIEILEAAGALDLDERESAWRGDGWVPGGSETYAPGGTAGMTGTDAAPATGETGHGPGGTAGMTGYAPAASRPDRAPATATGRRDAGLPGVRVRAYDR